MKKSLPLSFSPSLPLSLPSSLPPSLSLSFSLSLSLSLSLKYIAWYALIMSALTNSQKDSGIVHQHIKTTILLLHNLLCRHDALHAADIQLNTDWSQPICLQFLDCLLTFLNAASCTHQLIRILLSSEDNYYI